MKNVYKYLILVLILIAIVVVYFIKKREFWIDANPSCYGADTNDKNCITCDQVKAKYTAKKWGYKPGQFKQCSCYDANNLEAECKTCDSVIKYYKDRNWAYNTNDFYQCIPH
jgi:hypothetical protein